MCIRHGAHWFKGTVSTMGSALRMMQYLSWCSVFACEISMSLSSCQVRQFAQAAVQAAVDKQTKKQQAVAAQLTAATDSRQQLELQAAVKNEQHKLNQVQGVMQQLMDLSSSGNSSSSVADILAVAGDQIAETLDADKGASVADHSIFRAHAAKYEVGDLEHCLITLPIPLNLLTAYCCTHVVTGQPAEGQATCLHTPCLWFTLHTCCWYALQLAAPQSLMLCGTGVLCRLSSSMTWMLWGYGDQMSSHEWWSSSQRLWPMCSASSVMAWHMSPTAVCTSTHRSSGNKTQNCYAVAYVMQCFLLHVLGMMQCSMLKFGMCIMCVGNLVMCMASASLAPLVVLHWQLNQRTTLRPVKSAAIRTLHYGKLLNLVNPSGSHLGVKAGQVRKRVDRCSW